MFQVQIETPAESDAGGSAAQYVVDNFIFGDAGPLTTIVDAPIVVTQSTNYTNYSLADISEIQFQTTAASTATFQSTQFDPAEGHIQSTATITGDSNADTIAIDVKTPYLDGGYGFDGSHLQFDNWSNTDKFFITLEGASIPSGSYVEILGTSGSDTINLGSYMSQYTQVNGEGGVNTVQLSGDYSAGLFIKADMMQNIQNLVLTGGNSYNLDIAGGVVDQGQTLVVNASKLGAGDTLEFGAGGLGKYIVNSAAGTNEIGLNSEADAVICGSGTNNIYAEDGLLAVNAKIEGAGTTYLTLGGDYSAGYTFGATTFTNITQLNLNGGDSYKLTLNNANVAAGATLYVDANALQTTDSLTFNGSHVANGQLDIIGGAGMNILTGGAQNDSFEFLGAGELTAADRIDGGGGTNNYLTLDGDYSSGLKFGNTTIENIQGIELLGGSSYKLILANGNVAAGQTLAIYASGLQTTDTLNLNGSKVAAGNLIMDGGAGNDTLIGGDGTNTFEGGGGADIMTAGSGMNIFQYQAVSESTSTSHDTINNFNALTDTFSLQGSLMQPNAIDSAVTSGALGTTSFDTQLAHDLGASQLHAGDAVLFTPSSGAYSGHTFLVIDENGVAGYQAGQDFVIELNGATNMSHFSLANFGT